MDPEEFDLNPWHPPCPDFCGHKGEGWPLLPADEGFWFQGQIQNVDFWCENCNAFWTVEEVLASLNLKNLKNLTKS